jgi:excisionase family DNA binding protein
METVEIAGIKYVKLDEICTAMGVEEKVILRYIRKGAIQAKRVGRSQYMITEESLNNFLKKQKEKQNGR